jgi:hypothetical protein
MKKIQLLLIGLLAFNVLYAQKDTITKVRELGIYSSGIVFKFGNPDFLWVIRVNSLNVTLPATSKDSVNYQATLPNGQTQPQTSSNQKYTGMGLGFNIGFEKYHKIIDKLSRYYGALCGLGYSYYQNNFPQQHYKNISNTFTPSIGIRLGLKYDLSTHFKIATDLSPTLTYTHQIIENDQYGISSYTIEKYSYNNIYSTIALNLLNPTFTLTYCF